MAADSLTKRNSENSAQTREETRSNENFFRPAVNIIETDDGLVLTADIPGAGKESLDLNVEKGILTINVPVQHKMPGTPTYREFELMGSYYRQFTIPESLDHEKAKAEYANGILTLRIPKAPAAKPKRIAVKVA
jgi:HSP20 family molecular chaperone IbpA